MSSASVDEEIIAIKMFIQHIHNGQYKFVRPDPEDLDFKAEQMFQKRASSFQRKATLWLEMLQSDGDSEEFKKFTRDFHSSILYWRAKRLVAGELSLAEIIESHSKIREESRKLKAENERLHADNKLMAAELAKYRRPPIVKEDVADIKGEA